MPLDHLLILQGNLATNFYLSYSTLSSIQLGHSPKADDDGGGLYKVGDNFHR